MLYILSILTFMLFAWDKHSSLYKRFRIPELLLLVLSFVGGAFGALCAMIFFKHKTSHRKFVICVPAFLCMQIAMVVLLRVF